MQNGSHSRSSHPLDKRMAKFQNVSGWELTSTQKSELKKMHKKKQRQYNIKLSKEYKNNI